MVLQLRAGVFRIHSRRGMGAEPMGISTHVRRRTSSSRMRAGWIETLIDSVQTACLIEAQRGRGPFVFRFPSRRTSMIANAKSKQSRFRLVVLGVAAVV